MLNSATFWGGFLVMTLGVATMPILIGFPIFVVGLGMTIHGS